MSPRPGSLMPLMAPACAAVMSLMPDISLGAGSESWALYSESCATAIPGRRGLETIRSKPEAGTINGAQVESRGVLLPFSPAIFAHFMVSEGLIGLAGTKKTVGPLPGRQGEDLVDAFARHAAGP